MKRLDPRLAIVAVMVLAVLGTAFFTPLSPRKTISPVLPAKAQPAAVAANQVQPSSGVTAPDKIIWTETRTLTAGGNASRHFRKYRKMFGVKTVEDYVARATAFLHNPPPGTQTRTQKDGDTVRFNPYTNEFGVMTPDGIPRTYYKPNPDIHGYPTNQTYFEAQ